MRQRHNKDIRGQPVPLEPGTAAASAIWQYADTQGFKLHLAVC
jgi:hypothetical protein